LRVRSLFIKRRDKAYLGKFAESVVKSFSRKLIVTPHIIQRGMGITSSQTAREVLTGLYDKKILLKTGRGTVYYINPNPPSALSPYFSQF